MARGFFNFLQNKLRRAHRNPALRPEVYTAVDESTILFRNVFHVLPANESCPDRYIITADINPIYSGLGCMIRVIAPCWMYAKATGRTLVIDWRGNPYTRNEPSFNLFPALFEPIDSAQSGMRVISDQSVDIINYPQPLLTTSVPMELEDGTFIRIPNGGLDHDALGEIIANCTDVDGPTILPSLASTFRITRKWIVPHEVRLTDKALSACYGMLKPKSAWASLAQTFYDEQMRGQPVIGLHVRHGNGEGNFREHFRHREINDFDAFIQLVCSTVKAYGKHRFGENFAVFLATDSQSVIDHFNKQFSRLITRPIWRPERGAGVDFDHAFKEGTESGIRAAAEALIDMLVLAKCDAVMQTRFTSFAYHVRYILEKPDAEFFDDVEFAELASQLEEMR